MSEETPPNGDGDLRRRLEELAGRGTPRGARSVLAAARRGAPVRTLSSVRLGPARIVLWLKVRDAVLAAATIHALYRAFFGDDVDISKPENAAAVAVGCGVDGAAARAAIDDPAIKDALRRENEQAIAAGVFGSPFTIVDGEPFWGMDRLDQVDRWLATGGW